MCFIEEHFQRDDDGLKPTSISLPPIIHPYYGTGLDIVLSASNSSVSFRNFHGIVADLRPHESTADAAGYAILVSANTRHLSSCTDESLAMNDLEWV